MNAVLKSVALWPLEQLLNRLSRADPYIQRRLKTFAGKCLAVQTTKPALSLTIRFEAETLHLSALSPEALAITADATLSGEASALLELLIRDADKRALANPALTLGGDVQLLQDLYTTMQSLDLDWQDYLQPLLGDVLTHELGRTQQRTREFVGQTRRRLRRDVEDYLKEETGWLPHRYQQEEFSNNLDALKLAMDRISAKLARLDAGIDEIDPVNPGVKPGPQA